MGVFEDIEPDRVFHIGEIEEDDIIAPRFRYLMYNPVIEITMGIDESHTSARIDVLEDHTLHHRRFATSCHTDDEHMTLECFCIDYNSIILIWRESEYDLVFRGCRSIFCSRRSLAFRIDLLFSGDNFFCSFWWDLFLFWFFKKWWLFFEDYCFYRFLYQSYILWLNMDFHIFLFLDFYRFRLTFPFWLSNRLV